VYAIRCRRHTTRNEIYTHGVIIKDELKTTVTAPLRINLKFDDDKRKVINVIYNFFIKHFWRASVILFVTYILTSPFSNYGFQRRILIHYISCRTLPCHDLTEYPCCESEQRTASVKE
jgi:hypothetical protein